MAVSLHVSDVLFGDTLGEWLCTLHNLAWNKQDTYFTPIADMDNIHHMEMENFVNIPFAFLAQNGNSN
jgi:hypothetical protein